MSKWNTILSHNRSLNEIFQARKDDECETLFRNVDAEYNPKFQFCCMEKGKDTCKGDSGGAIMKEINNSWYMVRWF